MIQIYVVKVFLEKHFIGLRHAGSQSSAWWRQSLIYRLPTQNPATAQVIPIKIWASHRTFGRLLIIWPQAVGPKRSGLGLLVNSLGGNDAVPGMSVAGPGQEWRSQ